MFVSASRGITRMSKQPTHITIVKLLKWAAQKLQSVIWLKWWEICCNMKLKHDVCVLLCTIISTQASCFQYCQFELKLINTFDGVCVNCSYLSNTDNKILTFVIVSSVEEVQLRLSSLNAKLKELFHCTNWKKRHQAGIATHIQLHWNG